MKYFSFVLIFYFFFERGHAQNVDWVRADSCTTYIQYPNKITTDAHGNVIISAHHNNGYNHGGGPNDLGDYVMRFDPNGNLSWKKYYPATGWGEIYSLAVDTSGSIYYPLENHFYKLDKNGNNTWTKSINYGISLGKRFNERNTLMHTGYTNSSITLPGNVVIQPASQNGCYFIGEMDESGNYLWAIANQGQSYNHQYNQTGFVVKAANTSDVAKYDTAGNLVWTKQKEVLAIAPDEYGNSYAFEIDLSDVNHYSNSNSYLVKYDNTGNEIWKRTRVYWHTDGTSCDLYKFQMVCGPYGAVYISGGFAYSMILGDSTINGDNHWRAFVAKLDSSGKLKWVITSIGSGNCSAKDLSVRGNKIYVTGDLYGQCTFGSQTANLNPAVFTMQITDNDVTGIQQEATRNLFSFDIFPNPSGSTVNIRYKGNAEDVKIIIRNELGQNILSRKYSSQKEIQDSFNMDNYPKGTYFIELITEENKSVRKIILQ